MCLMVRSNFAKKVPTPGSDDYDPAAKLKSREATLRKLGGTLFQRNSTRDRNVGGPDPMDMRLIDEPEQVVFL